MGSNEREMLDLTGIFKNTASTLMRSGIIQNLLLRLAVAAAIAMGNDARAAADSDRAALQDVYRTYAQAIKNKDAQTVFDLESDDFSIKLLQGKTLNRQQANALFQQMLRSLKTISGADVQLADVKSENGNVTAVISERVTGMFADKENKEHQLLSATKSRDVWSKMDGKWKIKFSEVLEDSSTVDGKAVQ